MITIHQKISAKEDFEAFLEAVKAYFPNKFDTSHSGAVEVTPESFRAYPEVAFVRVTQEIGGHIFCNNEALVLFQMPPHSTWAEGLQFMNEWFPDSWIVDPPNLYCWWD